jgi:hypothetical protein
LKSFLKIAALFSALSAFAAAETLTGTVTNGTTNKPAAGDEVVLLKLAGGMEEAARTKTDSKGRFSLNLDDAAGPHLVRVIHQGVTYHRMAPPGTTSVEAEVFDVAPKVEGLSYTVDVMRFETTNNQLSVTRLFAIRNASKPPRTQMNDQNFEFYLPDGAQIDQAMARTQGGQPINATAVPQKEKNRYAFIFPLRPGETQFQISYHLPYSGQASIEPKSVYPLDHFVVVLPKTMQFSPQSGAPYQGMQDQQEGTNIQVVTSAQPGQALGFKLSGTGVLPGQNGAQTASGEAPESGRDTRPGGGIGAPIDAPDPLAKYTWYILGGLGLGLVGGAIYIAKRPVPPAAAKPARTPSLRGSVDAAYEAPAAVPAPGNPASNLLAALKEELFELEVERQEGRISQPDYEKQKAALDQTLQRAIKRQAQKV